jgi:hypothetical protein
MICDNDNAEYEREVRGGMVLAAALAVGLGIMLAAGVCLLMGGCGR